MPRIHSIEGIDHVARTFRLLGDCTRLAMIHALLGGSEKCVGRLAGETGHSQANTSKHLKQLTHAGILSRRKDGLQVYYRLADPIVERLWRLAAREMTSNGRERRRQ